ncbi:hypothetical protein PsorP6_003940 [Peronosclerospora sorghi]|uniref:Uncharacterized protein n=1 Tax=Peronosclerospora sorghi TaxID=230839 RepID=A0ACC0VPP2_9STRA|nr:hypothetical protein PsorP6_003940 [Peronosclerospora sorghi]
MTSKAKATLLRWTNPLVACKLKWTHHLARAKSWVLLDPHVGCYAINTEVNATEDDQFLAFVQVKNVLKHVEEEEERAIVKDASLPIPDEIGLVSARIVDIRNVNRTGKKLIQYMLEIRTTNYGTIYCWKRYSTIRSLCDLLMKENGMKRRDIPDLPHRHLFGNFSQQTIGERAEKRLKRRGQSRASVMGYSCGRPDCRLQAPQ